MLQQPVAFEKPRWLRDLLRFLPLKSQFMLTGNVRDLQACEVTPGVIAAQPFEHCLRDALREAGFSQVVIWSPVAGFEALPLPGETAEDGHSLLRALGLTPTPSGAPAGPDLLAATLRRLLDYNGEPVALIVDFASRLVVRGDSLSDAEHRLFTQALVGSHRARSRPSGASRRPFFNTVLWVAEHEGDLPDWLSVENPRIRHIPVAKPDQPIRRALAPGLLRGLSGAGEAGAQALQAAAADLVETTEGLLLADLNAIAQLARVEGLPFARIGDAVRRYKIGVTEDPWQRIDRARIRDADTLIRRRVIGQTHAVTHMLDLIKRAMTGVGGGRKGNRPRGIAFLAGPTGVGKTELAKTVTQLLFGDEGAYIRFDMSEFSAEHADQRLIGAPPGYVGYDMGGELTNAVREKPFSVVLFDEIEKAHPRILDKFLQILDDGVLTSGRGDRVYFSESLIVFTSNLGIYRQDESGARVPNVSADEPYAAVQAKVRVEIERHFKLVLNRPEILNRIGENIIVFDFIRPDVAAAIFEQMVDQLLADLAEQSQPLSILPAARDSLRARCLADLSNGGRGIRNQLESALINPLARALFDQDVPPGQPMEIVRLTVDGVELARK